MRPFVGTHEQSEAAIAVGLTYRYRGLAVLVRSYRALCLPGLITEPVGASLLAKAVVQTANKVRKVLKQAASPAFDLAFDLRRPVKPRWPEFDVEVWGKPARMPV